MLWILLPSYLTEDRKWEIKTFFLTALWITSCSWSSFCSQPSPLSLHLILFLRGVSHSWQWTYPFIYFLLVHLANCCVLLHHLCLIYCCVSREQGLAHSRCSVYIFMEMNKARGHMWKTQDLSWNPWESVLAPLPSSWATLNKSLISLNQRILKSNNRGQQCPLYLLYCVSDHNKDEIISHRTLAAFCLTRLGHSVEAGQVTPDLPQTQGQSPKWTKIPLGFHLILNQFWESNLLKSGLWAPTN